MNLSQSSQGIRVPQEITIAFNGLMTMPVVGGDRGHTFVAVGTETNIGSNDLIRTILGTTVGFKEGSLQC